MKTLNNWLNTKKIFLNVNNTEVDFCKLLKNQTDFHFLLKLKEKRLCPIDSVKSLGTKIYENPTRSYQINIDR